MTYNEIKNNLIEKVELQLADYMLFLGTLYTTGEINEGIYDSLVDDACEKGKFKKLKIKIVIGEYE